jgi:hypothetical protein
MKNIPLPIKNDINGIFNTQIDKIAALRGDTTPFKLAYLLYNGFNEICTLIKVNNITEGRDDEYNTKKIFFCFIYSSLEIMLSLDLHEKVFIDKTKDILVELCDIPDDFRDGLDQAIGDEHE